MRDNLSTLYGKIDDAALEVRLGKHAKKELEGYLECGVLGRGSARLRCGECKEFAPRSLVLPTLTESALEEPERRSPEARLPPESARCSFYKA